MTEINLVRVYEPEFTLAFKGNLQRVKVVVVILCVCKYNKYVKDCHFADIEKRNRQ